MTPIASRLPILFLPIRSFSLRVDRFCNDDDRQDAPKL
jgi:hypothetical protein